ncbi:MAG: DUF2157 domain-containing protein, partial [Fusobacteriaceae bacterium]
MKKIEFGADNMIRLRELLQNFSMVFFLGGITFLVAHNWNSMSNIERLAIPSSLIVGGIYGWFFWQKKERYRKLSLFFASFLVGVLLKLHGEIYQTSIKPYELLLIWGLLILIASYLEKSYVIWSLNIIVIVSGLALFIETYLGDLYAIYLSGILIYLIFFLYCYGIKKMRFPIKNWFFYLLSTAATLLIS